MRTISDPGKIRKTLSRSCDAGRSIGFVPTMGALHEGHLSLIRRSARENDLTVVSIFVNPLQFGPKEDFTRYPRPRAKDEALCRTAGADILFIPTAEKFYGPLHATFVDVTGLSGMLCGETRPGHFRGVSTVVAKLFNLVRPTTAYFGQKDYQQTVVLRKMTSDLSIPVRIKVCPTVRERDGLAMSSRNRYLSPAERLRALSLYRSLALGRKLCTAGERDVRTVLRKMNRLIRSVIDPSTDSIDYISINDPGTLSPLERIGRTAVLLVAVRIGSTRLIDNLTVKVPSSR